MLLSVEYPILGSGMIPQEHGYAVFSALCRVHPWMHGHRRIQISPVNGTRDENPAFIRLTRQSKLCLRGLDLEEMTKLTGSVLDFAGVQVTLAPPTLRPLSAGSRLCSRLVLLNPDNFEVELRGEILRKTGESPEIILGKRRALQLHGRHLLGHSVTLRGLSEEASLTIQKIGVGHCRTMGCGVFRTYENR
jgi:CRISPR-associated protein Cas6